MNLKRYINLFNCSLFGRLLRTCWRKSSIFPVCPRFFQNVLNFSIGPGFVKSVLWNLSILWKRGPHGKQKRKSLYEYGRLFICELVLGGLDEHFGKFRSSFCLFRWFEFGSILDLITIIYTYMNNFSRHCGKPGFIQDRQEHYKGVILINYMRLHETNILKCFWSLLACVSKKYAKMIFGESCFHPGLGATCPRGSSWQITQKGIFWLSRN